MFDVRCSAFALIPNEDERRASNIERRTSNVEPRAKFSATPPPPNFRPGRRFRQWSAGNVIENRSQTGPFSVPVVPYLVPKPTLFRPDPRAPIPSHRAHQPRAFFQNRAFPCTPRHSRRRCLTTRNAQPYPLAKEPDRAAHRRAPTRAREARPTRLELPAHSRPPPLTCRRKSRQILVKKSADAPIGRSRTETPSRQHVLGETVPGRMDPWLAHAAH